MATKGTNDLEFEQVWEEVCNNLNPNAAYTLGESIVSSEKELAYDDKYATKEQRERDQEITEILKNYSLNYKNKVDRNLKYKDEIFSLCKTTIEIFVFLFSLVIIIVLFSIDSINITGTVSLISTCITFLGMIIGLLKIITKYVFPVDEEEYITRIVESIQRHDFENKSAYMKLDNQRSVDVPLKEHSEK